MTMPPKYKIETLHNAQSGMGFLANMGHVDGHIFASGGTYHRPTWLHAANGRDFETHRTPQTSGLRGMCVVSLDQIFVVGEYGTLAVTTDQGRHWESLDSPMGSCFYRIVKSGDSLLVCSDSGLYGSEDDGHSWEQLYNSSGRLLGLCVDGDRVLGWGAERSLLVCEQGDCSTISLPATNTLTGAIRTPKGSLMVCGDGGQLFRSEDDGDIWDEVPHQHRGDFEDIAVVQGQIVAVGGGGTLLLSTDDGCSFHALKTNTRATLWSLCPVPGGAYIGGDQGLVMHIALDVEQPATTDDSDDEYVPRRSVSGLVTKDPKKR